MHIAWSLFGIQRLHQPPNAHPCHAALLAIIFAGIHPLRACFYKLQLMLHSWPRDLFSHPTQIILCRVVWVHFHVPGNCHIRHIPLLGFALPWMHGRRPASWRQKFTYLCCPWYRLTSSVVMVTCGMRPDLHLKARQFLQCWAKTLQLLKLSFPVEKCLQGLRDDPDPHF